jgi:hypothetical protein
MTYRAFVASTREDLAAHRDRVVAGLRRAKIEVDPMEAWGAGAEAPHTFSPAGLRGCNLCVLLVGFRRGTIPPGKRESITQLEYRAARRLGIDVLVYQLDDAVTDWPPDFDDRRRDPEVRRWREELRLEHIVKTFGPSPASIELEADIARWVVDTESRRARRFRRSIYTVMGAALALLIAALLSLAMPEQRMRFLSRFLPLHDPVTFNHGQDGYEIARVLTYAAQGHETNFSEEIRATEGSMDLLVNNAALTHLRYRPDFEAILRRGARVRIIVWDFSPSNVCYEPFCEAIGQDVEGNRGDARQFYKDLVRLRDEVRRDRTTYRGSLDFRVNPRPLFYTMWVRDWDRPRTALGHLAVHLYQGQPTWPTMRVSPRSSPVMLANLHAEFEHAWKTSLLDVPATPPR